MAASVLIVSKGVFDLAGCCAGLRLAQLARRAGGDRLHGVVSLMIFIGGAGLLGFGLGPVLAPQSEALARLVMIAGDGFERLSLLLLVWFIWRTFGRGEPLRMGVALLIGAALLFDGYQLLQAQRWPDPRLPVFVDASSQVVFSLALVWSTVEAWLERGRVRRQLALGLTEPAVVNRFTLWTLATGSLALVCLTSALAVLVAGRPGWVGATELVRAVLYCAVAGIILVGIFPPKAYSRWLQRAAEPASVEA